MKKPYPFSPTKCHCFPPLKDVPRHTTVIAHFITFFFASFHSIFWSMFFFPLPYISQMPNWTLLQLTHKHSIWLQIHPNISTESHLSLGIIAQDLPFEWINFWPENIELREQRPLYKITWKNGVKTTAHNHKCARVCMCLPASTRKMMYVHALQMNGVNEANITICILKEFLEGKKWFLLLWLRLKTKFLIHLSQSDNIEMKNHQKYWRIYRSLSRILCLNGLCEPYLRFKWNCQLAYRIKISESKYIT